MKMITTKEGEKFYVYAFVEAGVVKVDAVVRLSHRHEYHSPYEIMAQISESVVGLGNRGLLPVVEPAKPSALSADEATALYNYC